MVTNGVTVVVIFENVRTCHRHTLHPAAAPDLSRDEIKENGEFDVRRNFGKFCNIRTFSSETDMNWSSADKQSVLSNFS